MVDFVNKLIYQLLRQNFLTSQFFRNHFAKVIRASLEISLLPKEYQYQANP